MRALVCYNPKSGKQKLSKNLDLIKKELNGLYEVDVYETTGEKSLIYHLEEHAKNYDLLIVSGGDGTLNETVTGLMKANANPKIAYVPGGTCNDVGSMLRLSKNVKKTLKLIKKDQYEEMDICKADDKYFVYVIGSGQFIDISYATPHKYKRKWGRLAYYFYALKELTHEQKIKCTVDFDGLKTQGEYYVVLGLNSSHLSGFTIWRKKSIKLNDGLFDLTLIHKDKTATFLKLADYVLFGDYSSRYGIEKYKVSKFHLKSEQELDFNLDGEFGFRKKECTVEIIPKAIKIMVPAKTKKRYF